MGDAAEEGGARTVDADALEVFVPGRLCLLGEHSDWVRRLSPALSSHAAAAPAPIVHVLTRPCVPPSRRPCTVTDACVADSSRIQIPRCQWTCAPPHSLHTRGCEPHGHAHALTTSTRVELRQAGGFRSANPAIARGCTLVVGTTQGLHASVKAHPTHLMLVRIRPTPHCLHCCGAAAGDNWQVTTDSLVETGDERGGGMGRTQASTTDTGDRVTHSVTMVRGLNSPQPTHSPCPTQTLAVRCV